MLGITGTGGAGKSSLVDELVRRFLLDFKDKTIGIDLGRSVQTQDRRRAARRPHPHECHPQPARVHAFAGYAPGNLALSGHVRDAVDILKAAGFDLIILETSGIGQATPRSSITAMCRST